MAELDGQEKTEQATGKRLQESRDKGKVAKSIEINSVFILLVGMAVIYFTQKAVGKNLFNFSAQVFSNLNTFELNSELLKYYAVHGVLFFFSLVSPIFIGLVIISFIASYLQVGFKLTPKAIVPKFSKLNPLSGLKNIFASSRSVSELLKSLFKITLVSIFAYWVLEDTIKQSANLIDFSIEEILSFMLDTSFRFIWKLIIVYFVIAGTDFVYQKFKYKKDLMMTKQEVKEEYKQQEGDPLIKGKIKGKQLQLAKSRMMRDVKLADVIITNPTHFAIAVKYDYGTKSAPKVLAKGVDEVAQRIKQLAQEHNIPLHEDVALARALYKYCNIGEEIPQTFYKAVAQILAYIYQVKKNKKKKNIV